MDQVTIVIPTIERPEFIERALAYYEKLGFAGEVLIGDSSDQPFASRNSRFRVYDCNGLDDRLTMHHLSHLIETPYAVYMGDDDFLLPSGLTACAEYLDAHPDYSATGGQAYAFDIKGNGARGALKMIAGYRLPDLPHCSAQERIRAHFRDYRVTLFCVTRRAVFEAAWEHSKDIEDRAFAAELLPAALMVAMGKVASLPVPYLMRQSGNTKRVKLPGMQAWQQRSDWPAGFRYFIDELGAVIAREDGIGLLEGARVAHEAFAQYLQPSGAPALPHGEEIERLKAICELV